MDQGMVERIKALKASIPKGTLDGLMANGNSLSPVATLSMLGE